MPFVLFFIKKRKGTADFVKRQSSEYCHPKHAFMITLFYENDKLFNQDTYDNIVSQIDLLTLECPTCHHSGCLIKHARYNRTFRVSHSVITVKIIRVLCKECGHTHAILLCDFVPYSQILIDDQLDIITNDNDQEILSNSPCLDLSDIRYVRKQFTLYWKQRLLSQSISLDDSVSYACFKYFRQQFMQIKATINSCQDVTHLTFF